MAEFGIMSKSLKNKVWNKAPDKVKEKISSQVSYNVWDDAKNEVFAKVRDQVFFKWFFLNGSLLKKFSSLK